MDCGTRWLSCGTVHLCPKGLLSPPKLASCGWNHLSGKVARSSQVSGCVWWRFEEGVWSGKLVMERTFGKLVDGQEHGELLWNAPEHGLLVSLVSMMYWCCFHLETLSYVAKVLKRELWKLVSYFASKANLLLELHQDTVWLWLWLKACAFLKWLPNTLLLLLLCRRSLRVYTIWPYYCCSGQGLLQFQCHNGTLWDGQKDSDSVNFLKFEYS